jgi:hypothetical protein
MPPGTYHFCNVFLGSSVNLRLANTGNQVTRIYVDSPSRPGSGCSGSDGTFGADNSVLINKEVGEREELLEIYLHGKGAEDTRAPYSWCTRQFDPATLADECKSDFMLDNSVEFYGTVYAPQSTVQAHNSVKIFGAVAADKVRLYNSVSFTMTGEIQSKPPPTPGPGIRKGWTECAGTSPTSDPAAGC